VHAIASTHLDSSNHGDSDQSVSAGGCPGLSSADPVAKRAVATAAELRVLSQKAGEKAQERRNQAFGGALVSMVRTPFLGVAATDGSTTGQGSGFIPQLDGFSLVGSLSQVSSAGKWTAEPVKRQGKTRKRAGAKGEEPFVAMLWDWLHQPVRNLARRTSKTLGVWAEYSKRESRNEQNQIFQSGGLDDADQDSADGRD